MSYAERTRVPVAQSQNEIQALLRRHGVKEFAVMTGVKSSAVAFTLPTPTPLHVKMELAMPADDDQAVRSRWRALLLCIKAKLESIASGISTMEIEFLPFVVCGDGEVVHQKLIPQIHEQARLGRAPARLMLSFGGEK